MRSKRFIWTTFHLLIAICIIYLLPWVVVFVLWSPPRDLVAPPIAAYPFAQRERKVISAKASTNPWYKITFETTDTPDVVHTFYTTHLLQNGWREETYQSYPHFQIFHAGNGDVSHDIQVNTVREDCCVTKVTLRYRFFLN